MLKALARIVRWTGRYRRNLVLGCVCSFFMTWATAAPVMLAAWLLGQVADDARGASTLDPAWVWLSLAAIVAFVALRFAFSYGKNRLQESIGYEVAPEERIRIGAVLKRVPLGYFDKVKTGDILATATTELGILELQGMKMGGVSGSRVIDSWGQRMLTVMMAWAIPCGSTWGVVPVLAVAFFGMGAPLVIVGIFCVCVLLMWAVGRLFGPRLVKEGERAGLVMELPPYHRPRLGNVLHGAILKSRQMFVRAIRVVAIFAFAIWALTYTATGSVEGSALYALGTAIEPITQFFGMGWQTFTAWLCALVLKESALGVLSGLFAGGATPNAAVVTAVTGGVAVAGNIGEIMAQAISAPEALAFIFAFTFNMPCAASVSATWGEVHSTKWTVITAVFYIASSLILGCIVFHAASLFF